MIGDHNLKISEKEYRDIELPSYSMLSTISKEGVDIINAKKSSGLILKFGSLVDDLCFDTDKVVSKYYLATSIKNPTPNVKNIVDYVMSKMKSGGTSNFGMLKKKTLNTSAVGVSDLRSHTAGILLAAKHLGIYATYPEAKVLKTVIDGGSKYFKDCLDSDGKVLIKKEMWDKAMESCITLSTHQFSKSYFEKAKDIELIYQYKFEATINGRRTKGMLDILKIDHGTKTIYPVDLKTGELPVSKFPEIMLMYGYYIQAALYRQAIINIVKDDFDLEGYKVAPFEFLYLSKGNVTKPLVYVFSEKMHESALVGFTDRYGTKHKGVHSLLKEYYDCKEGKYCNYTEEEHNSKGKIEFDENLMIKDEDKECKTRDKSDEEFDIFPSNNGHINTV